MSKTHAPLPAPGGPSPANLVRWNNVFGIVSGVVAVASFIAPVILQVLPVISVSPQSRAFFFACAAVGSMLLVISLPNEPKLSRLSLVVRLLFVIFTILSLSLTGYTLWVPETGPPTYFIKVYVYTFDKSEEVGTTAVPAPQVTIEARDKFGHLLTRHKTHKDGPQTMELPTYGSINIGVCGVFETYSITNKTNSEDNAQTVWIYIDQTRLSSCSE